MPWLPLSAGTLRYLGKGNREGHWLCLSRLVAGASRQPRSCPSNSTSWLSSSALGRVVGVGEGSGLFLTSERLNLQRGHWVKNWLFPSKASTPSPSPPMRVGRIRGSPAGAHSLQLWSVAALSNTRQHLQPFALRRPKIPIGETSIMRHWTGQNCVNSCMGGF